MKQDSCPIVGKVSKAASVSLDGLDHAIESFGAGVADPVPAIVEQTGLMTSEHLDHFLTGSRRLRMALFAQASKKRFAAAV